MNQKKIAETIKDIRLKNNLTQKDLADSLGVTYQAVSKWENGKNLPDIIVLREICSKYNIDINDLLENKIVKKDYNFKYIITLIIIIILIFISILLIYNKYFHHDFVFTTISTTCDNFKLSGSVAYTSDRAAIYISNISYCGSDNLTIYNHIESTLYLENGNNETKLGSGDTISNINLKDYLNNLIFNVDYQNCDLIDGRLNLTINAYDNDGKITSYSIPLTINSCPN